MALARSIKIGGLLAVAIDGTAAALVSRAASLPAAVRVLSVPDENTPITLEIGLKMQNIEKLEDMLRDVSDPKSSNYGQYLSTTEIHETFRPSDESGAAVKAWLQENGITEIVDRGFYINFATTVSKANDLLNSAFSYYDVQGTRKLRTREYTISGEIADHIELVTPTTYFGTTKAHRAVDAAAPDHNEVLVNRQADGDGNATQPSPCSRLLTPPCLKDMYGFGDYQVDPDSGSRIAFASFLNQSAVPNDLDVFTDTFDLPRTSWESVIINGGDDHQDFKRDVGEGNLDAQMLALSGKTLPMFHYVTGGSPPVIPNLRLDEDSNTNEPYLEFYQYLMDLENEEVAQVISISYGDDEQTVPKDYAVRTCNLMGMMGLRGITIIESTGDAGVGAPCRANDGSDKIEFTPQFPPSCPYITTVGGTQGYDPEVAWVGSAGGFSNYFERAWYQEEAIERFLDEVMDQELKAEYEQYTNYGGRGFPDISAHSTSPSYQIVVGGSARFSGGTSAAAPLIAGMVGLLNDARLRAGQPVMGFLNPWLYSEGFKALTDVVGGNSKGCDGWDTQSGAQVPGAGIIGERGAYWNATEGWDPATGLGMPKFEEMLALVLGEGLDEGDAE